MNLLYETQNILEKDGYLTTPVKFLDSSVVFEDASLIGIATCFESVEELMERWQKAQDTFLSTFASQMTQEPIKSWNAYAVFLTQAELRSDRRSEVLEIEENLRGARKIVGHGIGTHSELASVLYPLLTIEHVIRLTAGDHVKRLRERIEIPRLLGEEDIEKIYMDLEGQQ